MLLTRCPLPACWARRALPEATVRCLAQRLAPALLLRGCLHSRTPYLVWIPTCSPGGGPVRTVPVQIAHRPAEFLIGRWYQPLTCGKSFRAFPFHLLELLLMSTRPVMLLP